MSPNPDINVGVIRHVDPQTRKISVSQFSPKKAWANPKSLDDPKMSNRDTIILFSYTDERNEALAEIVEELTLQAEFGQPRKIVRVDGSVRVSRDSTLTSKICLFDNLSNLQAGS